MRRRWGFVSFTSAAALCALAVVFWPQDALAWGPLAHLHFARSALDELWSTSFAMRTLLGRFTGEYLYGCLAADIVVGKNLAPYSVHCHNWRVGFQVLERARHDSVKAFSLGFLSHLAVDTVAHNYYVPYKTVQSHDARGAGHAYWELRYDQKLPKNLWQTAQSVTAPLYRTHDEHLQDCLYEGYLIPFSVSKKMFGSLLLAARLRKWQTLSTLLAREREMSLQDEEVGECQRLAVKQIVGLLRDGESAECTKADPTGERNLHAAGLLRTTLRSDKALKDRERDQLVQKTRAAFRRAITGRLELPRLPSMGADSAG